MPEEIMGMKPIVFLYAVKLPNGRIAGYSVREDKQDTALAFFRKWGLFATDELSVDPRNLLATLGALIVTVGCGEADPDGEDA